MSGSAQCPHPELIFHIEVCHFSDSIIKMIEFKAKCQHCGIPMCFMGLPVGSSMARPTMALDGQALHIPMVADGEEPDSKLEMIARRVE